MRKKINYPAIILLLIVALLLVLLVRKSEKRPLYSSSAIMDKISYMQELSLVKYNYNGIIAYKDYLKFMNMQVPMTEKSFLIKYNGYVKAGIDMKQATVEVKGKTVYVRLPKPQVQESVIDEKSILVFDERMNLLNPTKITDYQKAIMGEKDKITKNALDKGILTESSDQAHKFIYSFLKDMGFEKIEISEITTIPLPRHELK